MTSNLDFGGEDPFQPKPRRSPSDKVLRDTKILGEAACRVAGTFGAAAAIPFGHFYCQLFELVSKSSVDQRLICLAMQTYLRANMEIEQ